MATLESIDTKLDLIKDQYERRLDRIDERLEHLEEKEVERVGAEKMATKVGKVVIAVVSLVGVGVAIVTNYEHWK